jgi:hypothetical protein
MYFACTCVKRMWHLQHLQVWYYSEAALFILETFSKISLYASNYWEDYPLRCTCMYVGVVHVYVCRLDILQVSLFYQNKMVALEQNWIWSFFQLLCSIHTHKWKAKQGASIQIKLYCTTKCHSHKIELT